jgi:hypothetical protein
MENTQLTQKPRRDLASLVAKIHGVTPDYVRKIIRTDRKNDKILNTVWAVMDAENKLLEAVKNSVPFNASHN